MTPSSVAVLNLLALTHGGATNADESLAWNLERGYVEQIAGEPGGLDEQSVYQITPAGAAAIHAEIHRGVGAPSEGDRL